MSDPRNPRPGDDCIVKPGNRRTEEDHARDMRRVSGDFEDED
jgi:hypothetical protein